MFKFFLTGVVSTPTNLRSKPSVEWISQKSWLEILQLSLIDPFFATLPNHVEENLDGWGILSEINNPMSFELFDEYTNEITEF